MLDKKCIYFQKLEEHGIIPIQYLVFQINYIKGRSIVNGKCLL